MRIRLRCSKHLSVSKSNQHYVFIIPVGKELDLKRAAASVGEKSVRMLPAKELLPLTGYVHGGCSPIGMKKVFRTVVDESASEFETIIFSAGKIGYQVEITLPDLSRILPHTVTSLSE
ncbi:Cys-tRNA(Pro)/Cys-tRNA(Cys) deacylase [Terribacillus halophilus]|uniref:Cys-tRNA(Pro)/Cys-tRNA(Cys) deacylase n=1 Tax=Terribacillus halophilus TaxID=361279 RepID=A0A1G6QF40_9BACI|nr:Cys-tRNA(Pro)/Cys-tRNA(Cys) deacylase [Terribacillus halophilus]